MEIRSYPIKWEGLGEIESRNFGNFERYKDNFLLQKICEKFKEDGYNHGMYFLKIYRFGEVSHLLGAGGVPN